MRLRKQKKGSLTSMPVRRLSRNAKRSSTRMTWRQLEERIIDLKKSEKQHKMSKKSARKGSRKRDTQEKGNSRTGNLKKGNSRTSFRSETIFQWTKLLITP